MREGGVRAAIALTGESWAASACSTVTAAISSPAVATGFSGLRSAILPSSACTVTGQTMDLVFSPSAAYDITAAETLRFDVPVAAVVSSLQPAAPAQPELTVTATAGSLTLSPATVSESTMRAGGAVLTLTLGGGESWAPNARTSIAQHFSAPAGPANGFQARRSVVVPGDSAAVAGQVVTVTLAADSEFDVAAAEVVTFTGSGLLFASGSAAANSPTFTITPERSLVNVTPAAVPESWVRTGRASVTLSLTGAETWAADTAAVAGAVAAGMSSDSSEPAGFNARKSLLIGAHLISVDVLRRAATIRLATDPGYDTASGEDVNVALSPGMFTSGLRAEPLSPPLRFRITPEAGNLAVESPPAVTEGCITEGTLRRGGASVAFVLSEGEQWKDIDVVRSWFSAAAGAPRGFQSRKAFLLPAGSAAVTAASPQRLVVTLAADPGYDIDAREDVYVNVTSKATASGMLPAVQTAGFVFCVVPEAAVPAPGGGHLATFTEEMIRSGGACLTMSLGAGETWKEAPRTAWLAAMSATTPAQQAGWDQREGALVPTATAISGGRNVMCLAPDAGYDIHRNETVSVQVPKEAVSSGLAPTNPYTFGISVLRGTVRVSPAANFGEATVRLGGARMTMVIDGETWAEPLPAQAIAAGFSCELPEEDQGFNARRATLLPASSLSVNGQELRVRFASDTGYDVTREERCSVTLPAAAVPSGLVPTGQVAFTVSPSVAFTTAQNVTFTDDEVRAGRASFEVTLQHDQWAARGEALLAAAFASNKSPKDEPRGFAARSGTVLPPSALQFVTDTRIRVTLAADTEYETCAGERVTMSLPPEVLQSQATPTVLPRGSDLAFSVTPTARAVLTLHVNASGALTTAPTTLAEGLLRRGQVEVVLILQGARWAPDAAAKVLANSNGTQGGDGWNRWKAALFPPQRSVAGADGTTLRLVGAAVTRFDVAADDVVSVTVPGDALQCGSFAAAASASVQITIAPEPGSVTVDCSGGLTFTDYEVRNGDARVSLALVSDRWSARYQSFGAVSNATVATGFNALRSQLVRVPGSFNTKAGPAGEEVLVVTFMPTPQYRLTETEVIALTIPAAMTAAGLTPAVIGCPLLITILPGRGRLSVAPSVAPDGVVRAGGLRFTLSLGGDEWDTALDPSSITSGISAQPVSVFEPNGFDANRGSLVSLPYSLQVPPTATHSIEVVFGPAAGYKLLAGEDILIRVPATATKSKLAPVGSPVKVRITRGGSALRFGAGSAVAQAQDFTAEVGKQLGAVVVEVVDSQGNVDPAVPDTTMAASSTQSGVSLSANGSVVPIVNGVATFNQLVFLSLGQTKLRFALGPTSALASPPDPLFTGTATVTAPGGTVPPPSLSPGRSAVAEAGSSVAVLAPIPFVSSCLPTVTLDASASTVGDGDNIVWTAPSGGAVADALTGARNAGQLQVTLTDALVLPSGDHTVCVSVGTSQQCRVLTVLAAATPRVHVEEAPQGTYATRSDAPLTLHATPLNATGCDLGSADRTRAYTYSWASSAALPTTASRGKASVYLPADTLEPGQSYSFTVTACPTTSLGGCSQGQVVVKVSRPPLSVSVDQGIGVVVGGAGPEVSLTARAARGREAVPLADLQWRCASCLLSGAALATQGPRVALAAATLRRGQHSVSVTAQHNQEVVTESVMLSVMEAASGSGQVVAFMSSPSHPTDLSPSADEDISLRVALSGSDQSQLQWNWACDPPAAGSLGVAGDRLLAPAGSLRAGGQYVCTATTTVGGQTVAVSGAVRPAPAPTSGRCTVSPGSGAQGGLFRVSCTGWTAPGGAALTYRYTRVTAAGEADLGGGWRGGGDLRDVWLVTEDGQPGTVTLHVYVRYPAGSSAKVSLTVSLTGTRAGAEAAAAGALLRWQNGDWGGAVSQARGSVFANSMTLNSSATNVASVADGASRSAASPAEVQQALSLFCAQWSSGTTPAVAASQAGVLSAALARLTAQLRITGRGAGPDAALARGCAARGAASILRSAVPQDESAAVSLIAAVHSLLGSGSDSGGTSSEVTDVGDLSVAHISSTGPLNLRPFPVASRSGGVSVSVSSSASKRYAAGVSAWRRLPQGGAAKVRDGTAPEYTTSLVSQVVGVVLRADGAALPPGVPVTVQLPLLLGSADSHKDLLAVYWDPAAKAWQTGGVSITSAVNGLVTVVSQHLTDFGIVRQSAGTPAPGSVANPTPAPAGATTGVGTDDDSGVGAWWVWLIVAAVICIVATGVLWFSQKKRSAPPVTGSPARDRSPRSVHDSQYWYPVGAERRGPFAGTRDITEPSGNSFRTAVTQHRRVSFDLQHGYGAEEPMHSAQGDHSPRSAPTHPNPIDDQWGSRRPRPSPQPFQPELEPAISPLRYDGSAGFDRGASLSGSARASPMHSGSVGSQPRSPARQHQWTLADDEPGA
eukprot:TRINITY_DN9756_c1_g1_i2.p1 TRINITY_DN9756_c1_g1~~TRINITY_DN9756_c1_g1_i2.p1  ORF type:complete len:2411 (+),score=683.33 TRINITY_DN9756_c1_g1_i2:1352-8584(+)